MLRTAEFFLKSYKSMVEPYLPISYINDFIFCPRSIYFHGLYGSANESLYHTTDQSEGRMAHKTVDSGTYTTSKKVLQGIEVYSEKYGIGGKIDIFDGGEGLLVERKKKIKTVYEGYIYQLYAQYHCLCEMDYRVKAMKLYSMDDNKSYPVLPPQDDTPTGLCAPASAACCSPRPAGGGRHAGCNRGTWT